ncbi:MAG TPA: hypothetical protein VFW13_15810, partial [Phenylobacterium sp.]|nr:hypothetical protein [Phenylobacterium sp.]
MRSLLLAFGLAAVAATAASAATVTSDFEGLTTTALVAPSVVSQGYTFSASQGSNLAVLGNPSFCSPACPSDGTSILVFGINSADINPSSIDPLVITGSKSFQLSGFDYAELQPTGSPVNATFLRVTGVLADGSGDITRIVTLDGINDGPGGAADFQTEVFDSVFADSTFSEVDIRGMANSDRTGGFSLDNVVLTTGGGVPEPA